MGFAQLAKVIFMQNWRELTFWLRQDSAKYELDQYAHRLPEALRNRIYSRFRSKFKLQDYGPLHLLDGSLLPHSTRVELALSLYKHSVRQLPAMKNPIPGLMSGICMF